MQKRILITSLDSSNLIKMMLLLQQTPTTSSRSVWLRNEESTEKSLRSSLKMTFTKMSSMMTTTTLTMMKITMMKTCQRTKVVMISNSIITTMQMDSLIL